MHSLSRSFRFGLFLKRAAVAAALSFSLVSGQRVHAQGMILDVTGAGLGIIDLDFTWGWSFTVLQPLSIDGVAVFDWLSDGLGRTHTVALWRSNGTQLFQTTVSNDNASPQASTNANGRWMVHSIETTLLAPGNYVLGGDHKAGDVDGVFGGGTLTTNPAIVFGSDLGGFGSTLTMPNGPLWGIPGPFGPNLRVAATSRFSAPEPGSVTLLLLGGTLICLRRHITA